MSLLTIYSSDPKLAPLTSPKTQVKLVLNHQSQKQQKMNTPTFSLAVFVAMKRVCKGEMCFPASLQRCAIIDECKHADVMSQLFSNYLPQSFFRCFLAKAKSCPALVTHRHTHTYILYMLLFPHTPCVSPLNPLQLTFSSWHYVLSQYKLNRGPRRNKATINGPIFLVKKTEILFFSFLNLNIFFTLRTLPAFHLGSIFF